jgi:hypothetical protein
MTIDLGFGVGDDPPAYNPHPVVTDDGFMDIGGQLHYIGVYNQQTYTKAKDPAPKPSVNGNDSCGYWLEISETQCIYVEK